MHGSSSSSTNVQRQSADHTIEDPRESQVQDSEIIWSGDSSLCCKKLRHYPAFSRDGTTITVYSFAFIMGEEGYEHIGYLEDLYEDYRRQKMVKVRWLHRSEEVSCISIPPHEVLMTPDVQVVSAECIDGLATVLSPKHYAQCLAIVSQDFSDGIYMCSKQIKNNKKVTSFPLCKLRGYSNQTIFSNLYPPIPNNNNIDNSKMGQTSLSSSSTHEEEEEEEGGGGGGEEQKQEQEHEEQEQEEQEQEQEQEQEEEEEEEEEEMPSFIPTSVTGNEVVEETEPKLTQVLVSSMNVTDGCEPEHAPCFGVGEDIEVLSEDSGLRGCWFRCKILRASKKHLKVVYLDLEPAAGPGNVEEWIVAYRVAAPDKLQMRCLGRLTIRPFPPPEIRFCCCGACFSIGAAVDAWWCDAWWEGVVVSSNKFPGNNADNCLRVYFPGENMFQNVEKKNLRSSKDWVGNKWVQIKPKPDIISYLRLQTSSTLGGSCEKEKSLQQKE